MISPFHVSEGEPEVAQRQSFTVKKKNPAELRAVIQIIQGEGSYSSKSNRLQALTCTQPRAKECCSVEPHS